MTTPQPQGQSAPTPSTTSAAKTGMAWYNGCSEAERARWHAAAGSAVPTDAYRAFCEQTAAAAVAPLAPAAPAAVAPDAWQPIETAPEETALLLAAEFGGPGDWRIKMGSRYDGGWHVWGASWTPTRWMHLPPVPGAAPAVDAPPLPAIKGAWIDGGYVIVTPAGTGQAKAVKAAILAALPMAPAAVQEGGAA